MYSFQDLTDVIATLRSEKGCPWDREQTFESLKQCLADETEEAMAAVDNKDMDNLLGSLAPRLLVPVLLERADIPGNKKAHDLTKQERRRLLERFKCFTVAVSGPRPIDEAIITSGGVKVSEVDPKTMQSKNVPGLFFAGEMLDVDAYTGGFNLQIAWATGRAAGEGAVKYLEETHGAKQF